MLAVTYIPFRKEQYNQVEKTLTSISKKDTSFKFWIKKSTFPGFEYLALVRSYSLDQAHKRGLLITKKYLSDIQPPLSYEAREAKSVGQIYLATRSLNALSDPQDLALLVALKSAEPMSLKEFAKILGISALRLRLHLRRLRKGELVAIANGKLVVTDQGSSILAKMGVKGGSKGRNENG